MQINDQSHYMSKISHPTITFRNFILIQVSSWSFYEIHSLYVIMTEENDKGNLNYLNLKESYYKGMK